MDSLRLLWCFLLLALAALCPSVSMSIDDPAEGREDSSSGRTTVTVYHCKDCESSICQSRPISFENFEKIAETPNRRFSNGAIEVVTNETHVTVCFQQRNYFLEGLCGIFWEKDGGTGMSCGILKSGEHGRGNSSTEEKQICCKTETDIWKRHPALKCYTQKSHPEPTTPPADDPDKGIPGNPEFLTSKKSSTGILFSFLFVGFLAGMGTMYYCLRQQRGQAFRQERWAPEGENLTHL